MQKRLQLLQSTSYNQIKIIIENRLIFINTKARITKRFRPRFNKTLVLIKPRSLKNKLRLNIIEQLLKLIFV